MSKGRKEHVDCKKFGGTSVANKERIFNVARRCIEDYKKETTWWSCFLQWVSIPMS